MNEQLKIEQQEKQDLQDKVTELSEKLQETEKSLHTETYDRLRILREKRNQSQELGFKKSQEIIRMEQDY